MEVYVKVLVFLNCNVLEGVEGGGLKGDSSIGVGICGDVLEGVGGGGEGDSIP